MTSAGYSGTPLPKKLGIKEGSIVALVDAPDGFAKTLGKLPAGTRLLTAHGPRDLTLVFVRTRDELAGRAKAIAHACEHGGAWVCWPKKTSSMFRDLTEDGVREVLLPLGIVDIKVCAIDEDWSGLRFAKRKA